MKTMILPSVLISSLLLSISSATAHYLWVIVPPSDGQAAANIYFEEAPSPGDGHYLDHFLGSSKCWLRTVTDPKGKQIKTTEVQKEKLRWMTAVLESPAPRSVDCYGKFGVYTYGTTNVLLHYYARYLEVDSHEDLHELSRADQMELDIVAHDSGKIMELTVLWRGQPTADRTVYIRGPAKLRMNVKTDNLGRVQFEPKQAGTYLFRTSVEEDIAGEDGGEKYSLIRHNGTLTMQLPLKK